MTTKTRLLTLLTLASATLAGQAQTIQTTAATAASPPPLSDIEQAIKDIKNPFSWLSWGADLRVRDEHYDNILTLNSHDAANLHEQDHIRIRARLWTSLTPIEDLSFNVRLANESREWLKQAGYTPMKGHSGWDWRDGIFDNLNVQWKNILGQPASIIVGRQDYFPGTPLTGEGWLLADGTPYDGSWTYFLDSARVTYDLKEQHTLFDLVGIIQCAHDNGWLPTLNPHDDMYETEQNEKGAIVNIANSSLKAANVTGYFIYKQDSLSTGPTAPARVGDNADIYTFGGRVTGLLGDHWKYYAEGAYQFGRKQDTDINDDAAQADAAVKQDYRALSAFGANSKLTYLFKDHYNNQLTLSYEFLSGDDSKTHTDEMFDVLWGRWPRWSEIGLYSYAAETRIGSEANLHRVGPTWTMNPIKDMEFSASYFALFSDQNDATRGAGYPAPVLFTGTGNFRGHFLQAILKYKFSKHLMAHLWTEFELPGDYYVHRAPMYFLRPEIMLTF